MLPQKNRIKKADFKRIFKEAKAIRTAAFTLLFAVNKKLKEPQFAVVISTKVEAKAARRNKVKRQIKAIMKDLIAKIKTPYQIILICKPSITNLKLEEMRNLIKTTMEKSCLTSK